MKSKEKDGMWLYLILIVAFWLFCFVTLKFWLMPYSVAYAENGEMTVGYFTYAFIGLIFSTPAPFLSVFLISVCRDKVKVKDFIKGIFITEKTVKTVVITSVFCLLALVFALIDGTPNGEAWYMLPLGFLIMIPFVGIAEEVGWRGYLQPRMDKRLKYPFSVLAVGFVWFIWHIDLWFDPTSNHYDDSLLGFAVTIFIWAFALAAIYKATKSVIACACYHAFVDAIGAVYDWNSLFDSIPGSLTSNIYRVVLLLLSIGLFIYEDKKRVISR